MFGPIVPGLQRLQLFEGAGIGAAESAFVTDQQVETSSAVGEMLEDESQAIARVRLAVPVRELTVNVFGAVLDFVAQQTGFDIGEPPETPACGGHGLYQFGLDSASGGELIQIGIEQELEVRCGFGGKHDRHRRQGGGESVAEAVAGGLGAAFGGDGSAGLGAIGASGFRFFVGWHFGFREKAYPRRREAEDGARGEVVGGTRDGAERGGVMGGVMGGSVFLGWTVGNMPGIQLCDINVTLTLSADSEALL